MNHPAIIAAKYARRQLKVRFPKDSLCDEYANEAVCRMYERYGASVDTWSVNDLSKWVLTVAKRALIDHSRTFDGAEIESYLEDDSANDTDFLNTDIYDLEEAIKTLNTRSQIIVKLHTDGYSYEEIAHYTNLSIRQCQRLYAEAIESIRKYMLS